MKDYPLVHEDKDSVPVRAGRVGGNADDGTIEGVTVL
jgi:hypothetical protein